MRRSGTAVRATKKPVVVLAGEDRNDRQALRVLLEAFVPPMRGRIVEISDKVRLRQATGTTLGERVTVLRNKVTARAAREGADVACVFIHEDLDAIDSSDYDTVRKRVQEALDKNFRTAHYVLAAWELEAWLLLFPRALESFNKSWKIPARYRNKDTGLLVDPKRVMMTEVTTQARRYRESDAPEILDRVVSLSDHLQPIGSNRSWDQTRLDVTTCGAHHLPGRP